MNEPPIINGKPCKPKEVIKGMEDVLAPWACPECGANLSIRRICLNGCHLDGILGEGATARFRESLVSGFAALEADGD